MKAAVYADWTDPLPGSVHEVEDAWVEEYCTTHGVSHEGRKRIWVWRREQRRYGLVYLGKLTLHQLSEGTVYVTVLGIRLYVRKDRRGAWWTVHPDNAPQYESIDGKKVTGQRRTRKVREDAEELPRGAEVGEDGDADFSDFFS